MGKGNDLSALSDAWKVCPKWTIQRPPSPPLPPLPPSSPFNLSHSKDKAKHFTNGSERTARSSLHGRTVPTESPRRTNTTLRTETQIKQGSSRRPPNTNSGLGCGGACMRQQHLIAKNQPGQQRTQQAQQAHGYVANGKHTAKASTRQADSKAHSKSKHGHGPAHGKHTARKHTTSEHTVMNTASTHDARRGIKSRADTYYYEPQVPPSLPLLPRPLPPLPHNASITPLPPHCVLQPGWYRTEKDTRRQRCVRQPLHSRIMPRVSAGGIPRARPLLPPLSPSSSASIAPAPRVTSASIAIATAVAAESTTAAVATGSATA